MSADLVARLMPHFHACPVTVASGLVSLIRQAESGELPDDATEAVWAVMSGLIGTSASAAPAQAHTWAEAVGPFVNALMDDADTSAPPMASIRPHLVRIK